MWVKTLSGEAINLMSYSSIFIRCGTYDGQVIANGISGEFVLFDGSLKKCEKFLNVLLKKLQ